jgi:L-ascorbate metabolism protein UlaG (beta-lactamase superfamily)
MKIQQVRNATLRIEYAGKRFLVDPMLAEQGAFPGFEGTVNSHVANPTVPLGLPMEEILAVDAVIVTHVHPDHWDEAAKQLVPKDLPLYVQHPADAETVRASGFKDVRLLDANSQFDGVSLIKTSGQHGSDAAMDALGDILGQVCGVVFRHPAEKTVYLAGDTVWNDHVRTSLQTHRPDVVVLNAGDAQVIGLGSSIIMGKQDVLAVHQEVPNATLIATHMEAVNHAVLTRDELRSFARDNGMDRCLLVPEDGEQIAL